MLFRRRVLPGRVKQYVGRRRFTILFGFPRRRPASSVRDVEPILDTSFGNSKIATTTGEIKKTNEKYIHLVFSLIASHDIIV